MKAPSLIALSLLAGCQSQPAPVPTSQVCQSVEVLPDTPENRARLGIDGPDWVRRRSNP